MKRLILAMVLILPAVFQSCKDDDISLAGTEWTCKLTIGDYVLSESRLKFLDDKNFRINNYDADGKEHEEPVKGTYILSGSSIIMAVEGGSSVTGVIKGNKITLTEEGSPIELVYEKK